MNTVFKSNEVGFRIGEVVVKRPYDHTTPSNQIFTDFVSSLVIMNPPFSEHAECAYRGTGRVWAAQKQNDLSISSRNCATSKKHIRHAAGGWFVEVHMDNETKLRYALDLATQLGIDVEIKLEAEIKIPLQLYKKMITSILPMLKDGDSVCIVVPTTYIKTARVTSQMVAQMFDSNYILKNGVKDTKCYFPGIGKNFHYAIVIDEADIGTKECSADVILMNPPYPQ